MAKANSIKKTSRFKRACANAALRCSLLRIWLMKNLTMFLATIMIAILIIIATGNGHILPLIGMLFDNVKFWNVENTFWQNVLAVTGGLVTPVTACAIILTKTRNITLADIKSMKTKKAMIKAGLYFDKNGKLAKRPKDGKLKKESDGAFSKLLAPVKEFVLAITASVKDIDDIDSKVEDETVDIGVANVEENVSEPTFIENLAPTLVATSTKLAAVIPDTVTPSATIPAVTETEESSDNEEEIDNPNAEEVRDIGSTVDMPPQEDVSQIEESSDDTEEDDEEYSSGILIGLFTLLGTAIIAMAHGIRYLFHKTDEEKAMIAEKREQKRLAKQAKHEAKQKAKAEKTGRRLAKQKKIKERKVAATTKEVDMKKKTKKVETLVEKEVVKVPAASSAPATTGSIRRSSAHPATPSPAPSTPTTGTIRRRR